MKLKKFAASSFILIMAAGSLFAQQKQKDQFSTICKQLSKSKIIRGDFEQTQKNAKTGRSVNSFGKYTISAEDGMIWFTEIPVKSVMAVTKTYMIQEIKGRQRKIDGSKNPTFTHMADVISSLFTGKYEEINNNFEVKCVAKEETNFGWEITLTPKDNTISSYIKEISVDCILLPSGECQITNMKMITFTDDSTTYRLNNQVVTDNLNSDEAKYFEK